MKYVVSVTLAVSFAICSPAQAQSSHDPTNASAGVSGEVSLLDREITLATSQPVLEVNADGAVAGIRGHIQTGALFRAEVRALSGNLDFKTNLGESEDTVTFLEGRGTLGTEAAGGRFYSGAGVTYHSVDLPGIDWNTTTLYVPVGFAKANSVGEAWTARASIEGRVSIAGEEELKDVPSFGNVKFNHGVGYGARFAMTFRHDSGISIGGYVETVQPGNTDEEFGVLQAEDISNSTAGIHVGWAF